MESPLPLNPEEVSSRRKRSIEEVFTSDRTLRSHFLYVCMSDVRMSHNQIIRLNEKVNLIENLLRIELRTFGKEV